MRGFCAFEIPCAHFWRVVFLRDNCIINWAARIRCMCVYNIIMHERLIHKDESCVRLSPAPSARTANNALDWEPIVFEIYWATRRCGEKSQFADANLRWRYIAAAAVQKRSHGRSRPHFVYKCNQINNNLYLVPHTHFCCFIQLCLQFYSSRFSWIFKFWRD